ncbi:MAG: hypothetical protein GXC94_02040 [Comamonadaceae bacterium]|nr:hypothetical protein [Comamonadaceae bacterium]
MSQATKEALNALHGAFALELAKRIKDGTATAADLSVIRQFLKDNNVEALPGVPDTPMKALTDSLPFAAQGINH